ncbi:MAG: F0F1 ATP synthase subunit gamma [Gammaproteobacteria bacterium]
MSGAKEIRSKIKSIKSTQKITRAMEMVAASKMRKAQDQMLASRPYASHIREVINHVSKGGQSEYRHPYLVEREVKRVGLIVISSDRGLCGGLNANLFRTLIQYIADWRTQDVGLEFAVIGGKAQGFFKRMGGSLLAAKTHLGDAPSVSEVIGPVSSMLQAYLDGKIDAVYLAYNRFVNTMTQRPTLEKLLPMVDVGEPAERPRADTPTERLPYWDYLYEPEAKEILDILLRRFIESQVYQGAVENFACEQAARMVAMKSASDNAGQIIDDLQLAFNKARQAAITREISEIVSGAAAV